MTCPAHRHKHRHKHKRKGQVQILKSLLHLKHSVFSLRSTVYVCLLQWEYAACSHFSARRRLLCGDIDDNVDALSTRRGTRGNVAIKFLGERTHILMMSRTTLELGLFLLLFLLLFLSLVPSMALQLVLVLSLCRRLLLLRQGKC